MRTTEMVLIAPFLKTSNFYLPAYLYIYYLCLDTNPVTGCGQVCLTRTGVTHSPPHPTKFEFLIIFVSRAPRSIYCFKLKNPVRKACIALSESKTFEHFILVTILGKHDTILKSYS